jgi:uncharacterized membrane protein YdjX (TVP38/TMEM64 family)
MQEAPTAPVTSPDREPAVFCSAHEDSVHSGYTPFPSDLCLGNGTVFPASVLTIGAGFVFGVLLGTVTVSIAATTGAALAFLMARYFARDKIEQKLSSSRRFKQIDRAIGEQGPKLVFLLRLSPLIPFNLSNYFYGLTAVKFWPYVLASWIGMLPGTLLYVYLGAAGKAGLNAAVGQSSGRSPWEYVLFGIGLIATVVVTVWVTRIARRELAKSEVNRS